MILSPKIRETLIQYDEHNKKYFDLICQYIINDVFVTYEHPLKESSDVKNTKNLKPDWRWFPAKIETLLSQRWISEYKEFSFFHLSLGKKLIVEDVKNGATLFNQFINQKFILIDDGAYGTSNNFPLTLKNWYQIKKLEYQQPNYQYLYINFNFEKYRKINVNLSKSILNEFISTLPHTLANLINLKKHETITLNELTEHLIQTIESKLCILSSEIISVLLHEYRVDQYLTLVQTDKELREITSWGVTATNVREVEMWLLKRKLKQVLIGKMQEMINWFDDESQGKLFVLDNDSVKKIKRWLESKNINNLVVEKKSPNLWERLQNRINLKEK